MLAIIKQVKDAIQGKAPLGSKRSKQWPRVRKAHLKLNPRCALCGGKKKVEVHHIVPFHVEPALELVAANLITLCESRKGGITCHLFAGHLGSYRRQNKAVVEDACYLSQRLNPKGGCEDR